MKLANNKIKIYKIDAKGKAIGRIASESSKILLGKNLPNYEANKIANVQINILDIDKISITTKKLENTKIYHHSGYPSGLKVKTWNDLYKKNPKDLFMKVIKNMIPNNRHKKELLKKIKFV